MNKAIFKNDLEISFFISILAHTLIIVLLAPVFLSRQPFLGKPPSIIEVEVVRFLPKFSPPSSSKRAGEAKAKVEVFKPVPGLKDIIPKRLYVAGSSLLQVLKEREPKKSNKAGLIYEEPLPFDFEEKVEVGKVSEEFAKSEPVFNKEIGEEELKGHKEVVPSSLPGKHKQQAKETGLALKGEGEGSLPYLAQISKGPVVKRKFYWQPPNVPQGVEEKGISLTGELKFWVFSDGSVDPNIQIKKTSGYPEVDELFSDALKRGRCSPIKEEKKEWGILSFKIELK
ncbi:hypothetical protein KJ693_10760 [bacterium]|nr:hypothetical protein [bacterium]MBU1615771.1 hypothetical protein [bacterium]